MRGARRFGARLARVRVLALVLLVCALVPAVGQSASSAVVVSTTVPSAISLTNDCQDPVGYQFGLVPAGQKVTTSNTAATACAFDFVSSNDSAMIRIGQHDSSGEAAGRASSTWNGTGTLNGSYEGVTMYDDTLAFAVGNRGFVARSQDGGSTWPTASFDVTGSDGMSLQEIAPVPGAPTTWFAVGDDRKVVKVTSATTTPAFADASGNLGSTSWPATVDVTALVVTTSLDIVIVGEAGWVAVTANGGTNWTAYQLATSAGWFRDIVAISATSLIAVGANGTFASTTTGAAASGNWTVTTLGTTGFLASTAADATHVYASGYGGDVWRCLTAPCTNTANWTFQSAKNAVVQSVTGISAGAGVPGSVVASSNTGQLVLSTDNAATWTTLRSGTGASLQDVSVAPSGTKAIAGGYDYTVTRGTSLASWALGTSSGNGYFGSDASPIDGRIGVMVGEAGSIRRTIDGGATFVAASSPSTQPLFGAAMADDSVGWAVGESGTILKTSDGGASWQAQVSPVTAWRLWDVTAIDRYTAWAVGAQGTLLKTVNGGTTWSDASFATTATLRGVSAVDGTIVVVGHSGFVRRSTNAGAAWTTPTGMPAANDLIDIDMVDAQVGYLISEWQRVFRTADGGVTWTATPTDAPGSLMAIDAASRDTVFIVGSTPFVMVTRDRGASWTTPSVVGYSFTVTAIDENRAFAAGLSGLFGWTVPSVVAGQSISDYGAAPSNWAGSGSSSMFGVCLRYAPAGTTVNTGGGWAMDADGSCTANDAEPWRSIPAAPLKVASAALGVTGRVEFVWGFRPAANQAPGKYSATVVVEAVAPAV